MVRLIAWNCHRAFARKYAHLRDLDFDVAIVSECGPLPQGAEPDRALTYAMHRPVGTANGDRHLGLFAREPWVLQPAPAVPDIPWCSVASVTGPRSFTLVGVWSQTPALLPGRPSYSTQVQYVVEEVIPTLDGDVVVGGDFNAPASSTTEFRIHQQNVASLQRAGLVAAATLAPAAVGAPTYYHHRREDQPFWIDHVFVPSTWSGGVTVSVGTYAEWIASGRSDHSPIVVDVPEPAQ